MTAAIGDTHVIPASLCSNENLFTNAGWPVGHSLPTVDFDSGEVLGLGTRNVKMDKSPLCPGGFPPAAHLPVQAHEGCSVCRKTASGVTGLEGAFCCPCSLVSPSHHQIDSDPLLSAVMSSADLPLKPP